MQTLIKENNTDTELFIKLLVPGISEYSVLEKGIITSNILDNVYFPTESVAHRPSVLLAWDKLSLEQKFAQDIILSAQTGKLIINGYKKTTYWYFNNPDGTMRWVFPTKLKQATFLNFYSASSTKAKLFVRLIKFAFALKMQRFIKHGAFDIYHKEKLYFEHLESALKANAYSVFTGTVGENRKALIEFNSKGATRHFVKFPLNANSLKLIEKESAMLQQLSAIPFKHLEVPTKMGWEQNKELLIQSNINNRGAVRNNDFTELHANALKELCEHTATIASLNSFDFHYKIKQNLNEIAQNNTIYFSNDIAYKLKLIYQTLDDSSLIPVSIAHADFTPWNILVETNKLKVYDWELADHEYPLLFDVFHYVFQSKILLEQADFKVIKESIDEALKTKAIAHLIDKYNIDVQFHLKLYLLINISSYLNLYQRQSKLHKQAYWLLNVWNSALNDMLSVDLSQQSQRSKFIDNVFLFLSEQQINYAVLKSTYKKVFQLDTTSDIDLLVSQGSINDILSFVHKFPYTQKTIVSKRSNLTTIEVFFKDYSFLSLDLVSSFKRKSTIYLDAEELLLRQSYLANGFYKLKPDHDFDYILNFYLLNNSTVPAKYEDYYLNLNTNDKKHLLIFVNAKYQTEYTSLESLFNDGVEFKSALEINHKCLPQNRGVSQIKNKVIYLWDTIKSMLSSKGLVITLSGVDGAGKTTVINEVQTYLSEILRKQVVVLRHRPSVLPILSALKYGKVEAENRSVARLPRQGKNKSVVLSMVRFAYYYTDYILGQFYVYAKYVMRNKVVIYDRYYFDFINDPRRTNLNLPQWFTKPLYRLLLKPNLNFYLYAKPEVILMRKQELLASDIDRLNQKYLNTFGEFTKKHPKSAYLCIENIQLEETMTFIKKSIVKVA